MLHRQAISRSLDKNKNSTSTSLQTQKFKEEFSEININYCKRIDLKITEQNSSQNVLVTKNT